MQRAAPFVAVALVCVAAGTAAALAPERLGVVAAILVGAAVVVVGVLVGVRRSRRLDGRIDPFHPLLMPLAYLGFSFLAPTWAYFVQDKPLLSFRSAWMEPSTPTLMLIATIGLAAGLAIPFSRREPGEPLPVDQATTIHLGRLLLVIPLAFNLYNAAAGAVLTRGANQTARTGFTSLAVLASLLIPIGLLLLLSACRTERGLLRLGDWSLLAGLSVSAALTGDRSDGITIALCLLYAYTRARYNKAVIVGVLVAAMAFTIAIGTYRALERGARADPDATRVDAILTDLSVASYTTGLTAQAVPDTTELKYGATYLDAIVRQLPGEIANRLFGPPTGTGNETFRRIIGTNDPNQGWGYSLPAEGFLNFGVFGVFAACFAWGAFASWTYARRTWPATRARGLVYPLLIVTMPIAIRSDALGMTKSVLYPALVGALVLAIARARASGDPSSRSRARIPQAGPSRSPERLSRR